MLTRALLSAALTALLFTLPSHGQTRPATRPSPTAPRGVRPAASSPVAGQLPQVGQRGGPSTGAIQSQFTTVVPVISVDTTNPTEVNVGRNAKYLISVSNVGESTAEKLQLRATLSRPVTITEAEPRPSSVTGNELVYDLGDFPAKAKRQLTIVFNADSTGPVKLATRTSFSCSTQSTVAVSQPKLQVACSTPPQAVSGQPIDVKVKVTNVGDGVAEGVVLRPQVQGATAADGTPVAPLEIGWLQPRTVSDHSAFIASQYG